MRTSTSLMNSFFNKRWEKLDHYLANHNSLLENMRADGASLWCLEAQILSLPCFLSFCEVIAFINIGILTGLWRYLLLLLLLFCWHQRSHSVRFFVILQPTIADRLCSCHHHRPKQCTQNKQYRTLTIDGNKSTEIQLVPPFFLSTHSPSIS